MTVNKLLSRPERPMKIIHIRLFVYYYFVTIKSKPILNPFIL